MTKQKYRAVVRTADGQQMYGTLTDIETTPEEVTATFTQEGIERPVSTTDEPAAFEGATLRGFGYTEFEFRSYNDTDPERFSVQVSSLASERKVWIGPGDERAHLNEEEARRVRDALNAFLGEPTPHPPTREQIAEAMLSRVEIHRIICGQFGGPSTHDHQACENAANAVHAALIQNGADRG